VTPYYDPFAYEAEELNRLREEAIRAREKKKAQAIGRLIAEHPRPNTDREDLKATHDHAENQWKKGSGAVGPSGSEGWFGYFNNPYRDSFELHQKFGYHHDMQATDAARQAEVGPLAADPFGRHPEILREFRRSHYAQANRKSAIKGMWILKRTGDLDKALRETQKIFESYDFKVKQRY
jgi:hypothetical protein